VTSQSIVRIGALSLALLFAGCGSGPAKKAEEKKPAPPPEPVSGLTGIFRCFGPTRQWAQDIQVLRARNLFLKGRTAPPGKAYAWQVSFVSPSKKRIKHCTYSVVADEGIYEGVFNAGDEAYNGPTKLAQPFVIQAVKQDTDEIWKVALEKSKDYAAKNPDTPILFLLEFTERNPVAAWRVIWGASVGGSAYSVFVDATNGTFLKKAF
jgi:hypothetical protein